MGVNLGDHLYRYPGIKLPAAADNQFHRITVVRHLPRLFRHYCFHSADNRRRAVMNDRYFSFFRL